MMGMIMGIYLLINRGSTQQIAFLLPMALFSIMTPVANLLGARSKIKAVKKKWCLNEKKYRKVLAKLRARLSRMAAEQRRVALLVDPAPAALEACITERSHLWERRPEDPDFLSVRVGKGSRPFSVKLQVPEVDVTEVLAKDVQQLQEDFTTVPDIPCSISLPKVKSLGLTGRRQDVSALIRGLLCQIATHHSPEDVRIFGIYPVSQKHDWEWIGELPHTRPLKGCKLERLVAAGEDEANSLLNVLLEELSQRASKNESETAPPPGQQGATMPLPHLVVIVHDYVEVRKHPALTNAFKLGEQLGVSVIYMVAQQQAIPSECRAVLRLSDEGCINFAAAGFAGETLDDVAADTVELEVAMRIAQLLKPIQVAEGGEDTADLPTNVRFLDLVDLAYADQYNPEKWWSQPRFGRLRVPIGMGIDGPVWIDLNDSAHGPHGIIAGTTGAGKSELLQSLIVGLAITHHPHLVNFVLVDFKGGAAFKPFEKIPHTVGMVTDLSGRLTERALTALKSELHRREYILGMANAKKIAEYQAMRAQNPTQYEPLPNLLIIIDEFAELAKEHPTIMDGLVSVVQKGRSLGVHLILATQKPTGSVNPNIWSNLKFRICLRVASLQDSRDMLGRSEAALLPSTIPGRAYFQIGSEVFELFQSARISLPARVIDEALVTAKQANVGAGEVTDQKVLMDILEPYQATLGKELFKPWPAPLPPRVSLPEVYDQVLKPAQALPPSIPTYGWLACPVGLIDMPAEQRQEPWMLDLPHQGGHIMVAGASGTGKSVFLRTLITSLVRTHSPAQLHLYMVDFGGQALRVFGKLPHVGGVFNEMDEEYICRLLRKLQGIIEERKQFCMAHQIDDFLTYQRRRVDDSTLPEMPAVMLIIDKFTEFRQAHDKEMDLLISVARLGRTYGVYVVISVDRPIALPGQLMTLFELRIGLRLVELTDSLILIGKHDAARLDAALPGRGYKRGKTLEEVQIALPVAGEDDDEQTRLLDEMCTTYARLSKSPGIPHAPPIRLLPEYVCADYFLMDAISATYAANGSPNGDAQAKSLRIRLGVEDFSLHPIALELNADTPHVLVGGGPSSGRTGVLHTCLLMLASTPANKHVRVVLADFCRSSRMLRRLPNIWMYADTEERLVEAVNALKTELRARMVQIREELDRQEDDSEEIGVDMTPIVLVIDDYDQFSILSRNPFNDLKEFMLQARDLRFHIIVAGAPADLTKGEALLQQVRACRKGVVLGGDPADQPLLGVRMSDQPPGRGYVVRRNKKYLVQIANLPPADILPWVGRLVQADRVNNPQLDRTRGLLTLQKKEEQQLLEEAKNIVDNVTGAAMNGSIPTPAPGRLHGSPLP